VTRVIVLGPNLIDQSKGSFHVHAAGCRDINSYYGRQFDADKANPLDVNSVEEIAEYVYDYEDNPREYANDFYVFPCVYFTEKEETVKAIKFSFELYSEDIFLTVEIETDDYDGTLALLESVPNVRDIKVSVPGIPDVMAYAGSK